MNLRTKFNLILVITSSIGLTVAGFISHSLLQEHAEEEVLEQANLMMESALAVRSYTVQEVRPLLHQLDSEEFIPQTVPAYAASRYVAKLQEKHPHYNYKEATINPTNPENRATDWETDIITWFRNNRGKDLVTGVRNTPVGASFYFSRPIIIKNEGCLACHDTPEKAPAAVTKRYGTTNGFGWKMDEIIGAQIVSVPQSLPYQRAQHEFYVFMGVLVGIFVVIGIVMNILLNIFVIKPIVQIAAHADEVSLGTLESEELVVKGKDELSMLGRAINRMQRSLGSAMTMLNDTMDK
ncbi:MAG: c-type heme family protein [bacterium]